MDLGLPATAATTLERAAEGVAKAALVMFAGAGVSADGPSKVPDWYALNGLILRALQQRVMRYLDLDRRALLAAYGDRGITLSDVLGKAIA
jgi:hypothetical protein